MRRPWLLITLALLCALAIATAAWQLRDQPSVPMIPLLPAQSVPGPSRDATVTTADVGVAPADRIEPPVAVAPADERVAVLEVTVVNRPFAAGGVVPIGVAGLEVEILVDGDAGDAWRRDRTDGSGRVRFEVRGADGRPAAIRSPVTTPAQATLRAGELVQVTLEVAPRLWIRGRVVDATGRGVADADLVLLPYGERDRRSPRTHRVGRSAQDGHFALGLTSSGRLAAEHPAFAPSAVYPLQAETDPGRPPAAVTVELALLAAPGHARGRVVDANGVPVAAAELEFRAVADPPAHAVLAAPPQRARTATDGSFVTPALRPGRIEFGVRADAHGVGRGSFDLTSGATTALEIRLPPACEVQGRAEDERGLPLANVRVWSGNADAFESLFVVTGEDGTFRLHGLAPGITALTAREATSSGADPMARRAETRLDLVPETVASWVATLRTPTEDGFLRGQVVDTDGARLPTWRIVARSSEATAVGRSDSGGFFHVRAPGPGLLDVFVHAPDAAPTGFARAVQHAIDPERGPVRIVVDRRAPWGAIRGRVQDASGSVLPATVTCWHHERQEQARFQADEDGSLRLDAVPPGTVDVHFEHPGHARSSRLRLTVAAGTITDLGTVVLDASSSLFGQVTGPDGRAPEELQIALWTDTGRVTGEYAAGTYRFATAPPGRHVLQVQGSGVAAASFVVELRAGVELQQDMRLGAGVPRRVVVHAPTAAGNVVSLTVHKADAEHTWYAAAVLQPDADAATASCEFVVFMAPGSYETLAWAGDYRARLELQFVAGDESPVQLDLTAR